MGASHSHDTTVTLLGKVIGVTAFYQIEGRIGCEYPVIETVQADFGEITDILDLLTLDTAHNAYGFHIYEGRAPDLGWQDPIRTAMFGDARSRKYNPDAPIHPQKTVFVIGGSSWLEAIEAEIQQSSAFSEICNEDPFEGLD